MAQIMLSDGSFCQIDEVDLLWLAGFSWCPSVRGNYAVARVKGKVVPMHKLIAKSMGIAGEVDHKDQDKRNNQRSNLRSSTRSGNSANKGLQSNNASGFKGVHWYVTKRKWQAYIQVNNRRMHLGYFSNAIEAAKAYNAAALQYFGEFASLNPIP